MMLIDSHCHIGKGRRCALPAEDLIREMDANGVAMAIVVTLDEYIAVRNRQGNDYVLSEVANRPDRLFAMATVNPWYGQDAMKELRRAFDAGAIGLKLHPLLQGFKITDDIVYPLVELAGEYGKPVYFHTGTPICAMPFQLTELAMRFPDVTFVMGHMAFSDFWYEVTEATNAVDNIYLETSGHWPSFIVEKAAQVGSGRIMFGSDLPKHSIGLEIEKINRYIVAEEDRNNIFCHTAKRVFKELNNGN